MIMILHVGKAEQTHMVVRLREIRTCHMDPWEIHFRRGKPPNLCSAPLSSDAHIIGARLMEGRERIVRVRVCQATTDLLISTSFAGVLGTRQTRNNGQVWAA
jgi:hypothetical protein